jgi:hypothetical protein
MSRVWEAFMAEEKKTPPQGIANRKTYSTTLPDQVYIGRFIIES